VAFTVGVILSAIKAIPVLLVLCMAVKRPSKYNVTNDRLSIAISACLSLGMPELESH
jgi:hypothetical protein